MLSMTRGRPWAWATSAIAAMSGTSRRGIADRLEVDRLRVRVDRRREAGRVGAVDEAGRDPKLGKGPLEEVVASRRRGSCELTMLSPDSREVEDRRRLGGLSRGEGERRDAALERGDPLLEDVGRRVHDPGVDVPGLLQGEEPGGVVGVVEDVRRGRVDRDGPGPRRSGRPAGRHGWQGSPGGASAGRTSVASWGARSRGRAHGRWLRRRRSASPSRRRPGFGGSRCASRRTKEPQSLLDCGPGTRSWVP